MAIPVPPKLHGSNILVEAGGNQGAVMAFRRSDGSKAGSWGTGQIGHSSGTTGAGEQVYFGLTNLWINGREIPWPISYACNISTPGWADDFVVCTSGYNIAKTRCYRNGELVWESRLSDVVASPVVHVEKGNVYLPGGGYCLSLKDGSRQWSFGPCSSVILTGDDKLIVFDRALRLHDLTGNELGRTENAPHG